MRENKRSALVEWPAAKRTKRKRESATLSTRRFSNRKIRVSPVADALGQPLSARICIVIHRANNENAFSSGRARRVNREIGAFTLSNALRANIN